MFKIIKKDSETKARLGILNTPHGTIKTPSYVIVATHAQIKCLRSYDIKKTKTQVVITNTYHLWNEVIKNQNAKIKMQNLGNRTFVLNRLGTKMPTMTDSGGFQVFSLGFGKENKIGKILTTRHVVSRQVIHRKNIKITARGVYFLLEGRRRFLDPELSMKIQHKLGADIIFAFDECTSPLDDFKYNKKALKRTHRWAKECLKTHNQQPITKKQQMLFGIVQGGKYKSLRQKSAKFIASLPFDGIGIGGSFGKNEMVKTLKWIVPYLPEEKPRHLLGIGKIEDIFNAVENGIDLFDCVIPTREARHGRIYTPNGYYDIRKQVYSKTKLHKLFKGTSKEKLEGQRLATIQNILFFNTFLENIRKAIRQNRFSQFKSKFLKNFNSSS